MTVKILDPDRTVRNVPDQSNQASGELAQISFDRLHSICAAKMARLDTLGPRNRQQVYTIGWNAFAKGFRAHPKALSRDTGPLPPRKRKDSALERRGYAIAARYGLRPIQTMHRELTPEDFL